MSETIQQRLRKIRGKLSQREFAAKIGNDSESGNRLVSATETGRARPTDDYLKNIARTCRESLDELLALRDAGRYEPPAYSLAPKFLALRDAPPEDTVLKWLLDRINEKELRVALAEASEQDRFDVVQVLAVRLDQIVANKEPE